ncbi:MAG: FAD-dependent oxidoreductase [Verrucomicrobiota bacterium]|nr:FAD-dependent oxidoreductase [Verrucomicrobiota bacterium]
MSTHFDFLVIGGGSAGYAAARTAHGFGKRVAVVDGGAELGGLCILRGCMPSKTLIYAAEVLHLAKQGGVFGLSIPEARANLPALIDRKRRLIADFAQFRDKQLHDGRFALFTQQAQFTDSHTVALADGTQLTADKFMIATGSKVSWPAIPGLRDCGAWTSDEVLDAEKLPESMIVLGGGVVACELAQYLSRVGVQIIQIQRSPRILKEASPEASAVVERAFRDEGIKLITGTKLLRIEKTATGVTVHYEKDGVARRVEAKALFNALGREPNVASLGLAAAGVNLSDGGFVGINEYQQTSAANIYAGGDCSGPHEIVHVAILQGECAAKHAFSQPTLPVDYDGLTTVTFTDPQVAYCGLTEVEIKRRGWDFVTASYPFNDHGKSIVMEANYGYVKTWARKPDGLLLAAECVGKDAGELIHAMAVAIALHGDVRTLLKAHWYHPTLSEIWTYPLEECAEGLG